ncbi:hypothetical protein COLO4_34378 [Corchorus olitorius]|uniref:Uncharacterized protein n=1 Tax=Corchorus olitorius TaxID=93759 RepID=A0A1R3GL34_9ROSI|nr:hypothetical protein COLO4_34378 [Corchorus olitorius]
MASQAVAVDGVAFAQFAIRFHDFHVKPKHVAFLKEADLKGGKFSESTILKGKVVVANLSDLVGDLVLKAKSFGTHSVEDLEAMLNAYDDCVGVKFSLDFKWNTREHIHPLHLLPRSVVGYELGHSFRPLHFYYKPLEKFIEL